MPNLIHIQNTNENATLMIKEALQRIKENQENIILFEKSTYHFYREGTHAGFFCPSNNSNGIKHVVFPLFHLSNLTFDGNGSVFVFHDRLFPFILQHCNSVQFLNFTIDFSFPRYCMGKVLACGKNELSISISKEDFLFEVTKSGNLVFSVGDETINTHDKKLFVNNEERTIPVAYWVVGESDADTENMPAPVLYMDAFDAGGSVVTLRFRNNSPHISYQLGETLIISNDEDRENDLFFLESCDKVDFYNLHILRGAGMGILAQMCSNITADTILFQPEPDRKDSIPITADAFHFINCSGLLEIRNSVVKNALDDAINIHGVYTKVITVLPNNQVEAIFCHKEQYGWNPYLPGDIISITNGETGCETGTATVLSCVLQENLSNLSLTLKADYGFLIKPGDLIENPNRMPEVILENNLIENCPHIRLSSSQKMLIRNNTLINLYDGIYISDLMEFWFESGRVRDVCIEGNRIIATLPRGYAITVRRERGEKSDLYHKNIRILNNRFDLLTKKVLFAEYTDGLSVLGNTFVGGLDKESIHIRNCLQVTGRDRGSDTLIFPS